MNRFKDIIDDIRKRAAKEDIPASPVSQDIEEVPGANQEEKQTFRLPYSSEPRPIEGPWN